MDIKKLNDSIINTYTKDIYGNVLHSGDVVVKDYMYDGMKLTNEGAVFDYSKIYEDVLSSRYRNNVAAIIHTAPEPGKPKTSFIFYELFLFGICENFKVDNYNDILACLHLYQNDSYGFLPLPYDKPVFREYSFVKTNFNDLNRIYFRFSKKIFANKKVEEDVYKLTSSSNIIFEDSTFVIPFNKCFFYNFYRKKQKAALTRASWKSKYDRFPKLYLKYDLNFENTINLDKDKFFDLWKREMLLYCAHPRLPHVEVIYKQFIDANAFKLK